MELIEHEVTAFSNVVLTNDGQGIAFTLESASGPLTRLRMTLDEMPEFIAHLCQAVAAVHPKPRPAAQPATLSPEGVGLATTADAGVTLLVLRLAGMDLAAALGSTQVAALGDEFAAMARLLSAAGPGH